MLSEYDIMYDITDDMMLSEECQLSVIIMISIHSPGMRNYY